MITNLHYIWHNSTRTISRSKSIACDSSNSQKWTKQSWSFHLIHTHPGSPIIDSPIGPRLNESFSWDTMLTSGNSDDKATTLPLSKSNTSIGQIRELSRLYRTNISVVLTGPSHQQASSRQLTGSKLARLSIWASNSLSTAHRSMATKDVWAELWTARFAMLRTMASCWRQTTHTRDSREKAAEPTGPWRLSE